MRTAIVHYWLLGMRGGEKVVEALCSLYPDADIYTLFYDPSAVSEIIRSHRIHSSFLNPLRRSYRSLLPLMPLALESFDLRGYDLVISSESGPAKGVLTSANTRHICYCHSPMRYLWELYPAYLNDWTGSAIKRALIRPLSNYLRLWDFASAARVDEFIANSRNVQKRIWKTYRRESAVIYPPVAVETYDWAEPEDYFLIVSELVAYKQVDYAVRHFSRRGMRLRIVGDGPEIRKLRRMAGAMVEFTGRVSDAELKALYSRCRAFLMPGEEDFGMTMVEAQASGKPVIALARGGALEIVDPETVTGVLYPEATEEGLAKALVAFEAAEPRFSPRALQSSAARFSTQMFQRTMQAHLADKTTSNAVPANLAFRSK